LLPHQAEEELTINPALRYSPGLRKRWFENPKHQESAASGPTWFRSQNGRLSRAAVSGTRHEAIMKALRFLSPFIGTDYRKFNNANRLARILYRANLYSRVVWASRRKASLSDLLRKQFPFVLRDAPEPPSLSIEFTNHCNLACVYCSSPLNLRPKGLMTPETFDNLERQTSESGIRWISIVGNGEATLHPRYTEYVRRLAAVTKFLELTTNWHRVDEELMLSVLQFINLMHVSVDGASSEEYERTRVGGKLERLQDNLIALKRLKKKTGSKILVDVRVLVLPSQLADEKRYLDFWRPYGDVVSRQYVFNFVDAPESFDATACKPRARCTLPFKTLDVNWNGNVPLCSRSRIQTGNPDGLSLGNINHTSLHELWNGPIMQQYRDGHRYQKEELVPICKGCVART
jgi:MoaA/NifB/PqqE/SkfB family radical SAM enzyme